MRKFGLVSAAAMAAVIGASTTASAQSIEERINSLQFQIETLKQQLAEERNARIQQVEEKQQKEAVSVARKNPNVEVSLSGQISRGVIYMDNDFSSDVSHVDNDMSSSRIRFEGKGKISEDLTVGTLLEVEFESNPSSGVDTQDDGADIGTPTFRQRKIELYFHSKTYGAVFLGQGSMATDGVVGADLSGTGIASGADRDSTGGDLEFANSNTGLLTGIDLDTTVAEISGLGRDDRIRYSTPRFYGFGLAVAHGLDGIWDVSGDFGGSFGDVKVDAAAGYGNARGNSAGAAGINGTFFGGSIAALHVPSGVNVALAGGKMNSDVTGGTDPDFLFAKLGYIADIFPIGTSNFSIDWSTHDDIAMLGDEATVYSFGAVQNIKKVGTELFVNVRWNDLDRPGLPTEGIFTTIGGARVKF